jgi:TldD protein
MRDIAENALQAALDAGAAYADVRVQEVDSEELSVRNGVLETAEQATSAGIGVRVIVDGAWGFAAASQFEGDRPAALARMAVEVGRASARVKRRDAALAPAEAERGHYETPYREDPFAVGLSEKVDLLVAASEAMRTDPRIMAAAAALGLRQERTVFVSSEGSLLTQTILQTGSGISATAASTRARASSSSATLP